MTTIYLLITVAPSNAFANQEDAANSLAKIHKLRPSYLECLKVAQGATASSRDCMNGELVYQDNRLNKAYKVLLAAIDLSSETQLRSDENIWMQYRDSRCSDELYGIQQPELSKESCMVEVTAERASGLEAWLLSR